ncbi:MAG: glycosyltransferase family 2 protein [Saprospiraceae bacterium]|nr:glycosyltransferase family 2 protein [Saprospiraceae bacterium]
MDLSIIIPLKNEAESLPELESWIRRIAERQGYQYELIFIDDGSTDKSWSVIERLQAANPAIRAIKFRRNYGKSAALQVGFQASKGKVVITMDADLQDSPDEIPELYHLIAGQDYDLISGWKKLRHDPLEKRLPSKLFNAVASSMSGIKLHDFNCGLKAYRREVVKAVEIYGEMHRWIPVLAKWAGFTRIGEKVVDHRARKYGHSKYGWERYINGFLDLLSVYFVGKFGKRPMHFFGTLGVLSFMIGFGFLAYLSWAKLVYQEYGIADRPLFYFGILALIIGTQLFLTGFLAEIVNRNSASRNEYLVEKEL